MNRRGFVFTIATGGYDHLFRVCLKTQRDYCQRQGYDYLVVDQSPRKLSGSEASWLKIPLTLAALKAGAPWVAFLDADCRVHPQTPCFVEQFSQYGDDRSLYLAQGFSGRLNAGVIFARNTPLAQQFFQEVLAIADQDVPSQDEAPYENGHVIHVAKTNPAVQTLDYRQWNNNSRLDGACYIQHYSGGKLRRFYMTHLAPPELREAPAFWPRLQKELRRFYRKQFLPTAPHPPVSPVLAELVPWYLEKYPVFCQPS